MLIDLIMCVTLTNTSKKPSIKARVGMTRDKRGTGTRRKVTSTSIAIPAGQLNVPSYQVPCDSNISTKQMLSALVPPTTKEKYNMCHDPHS